MSRGPLLKQALAEGQTLEEFLPRAVDAWQVLAELENARLRAQSAR